LGVGSPAAVGLTAFRGLRGLVSFPLVGDVRLMCEFGRTSSLSTVLVVLCGVVLGEAGVEVIGEVPIIEIFKLSIAQCYGGLNINDVSNR
jgi:hypothetical protein